MVSFLRKAIREIHRRSIWQVLGVYLGGSWAVLQAVDFLTDFAGLPEWTPTMALVLLLLGLPFTAATTFLQGGGPGAGAESMERDETDAPVLITPTDVEQRPPPHDRKGADVFTWRNAVLGGLGAALLLVVSVGVYFLLSAAGIGATGSLVAQGVLEERDPILLATFENRTGDESLGAVVTDALRVDLLESQVVTLVDEGLVDQVLERMDRPDATLTPQVAREVAVREGIKAVVEGQVARAGSGYLLSGSLVDPRDGAAFAAFRETAEGDDELLPAIDRLSEQLRTKAGESLREVRSGEPLESVTTSSLEALKLYTRALETDGYEGTVNLLEEAVALDSTFAMAWRLLSVIHSNRGNHQAEAIDAATAAYRHRRNLTRRERNLAEGFYHWIVTGDEEAAAQAYQQVLDSHPHDRAALNNLGVYHSNRARWSEAAEYYRRAVDGPGGSSTAFSNLVLARYNEGRKEKALALLDEWESRYPFEARMAHRRAGVLWGMGNRSEAEATLREALALLSDDAFGVHRLRLLLGDLLISQGRLAEGRDFLLSARADARRTGNALDVLGIDEKLAWLDLMTAPTHADSVSVIQEMERRFEDSTTDVAEVDRPYGRMAFLWAIGGRSWEEARSWSERQMAAVPERRRGSTNHRRAQLFTRALSRLAAGEPERALESLLEARRLTEGCPPCYRLELARVYEELGRPDSAVVHLERILDHDALAFVDGRELLTAQILPRLARLYEEVGRPEDAADAWTRFADRWEAADDALQPQVRRARAQAERLTGGAGSP